MTYKIVRYFSDGRKPKVIMGGLTLDEAKEHCRREDTHKTKFKGKGALWFDGFKGE